MQRSAKCGAKIQMLVVLRVTIAKKLLAISKIVHIHIHSLIMEYIKNKRKPVNIKLYRLLAINQLREIDYFKVSNSFSATNSDDAGFCPVIKFPSCTAYGAHLSALE